MPPLRCLLPFALVAAVAAQNPPAAPPRDGVRAPGDGTAASVSGRVTDAESGQPLANALVMFGPFLSGAVTADSLTRSRGYQAITSPDGRYSLAGLPAGAYIVQAMPPSFTATHRAASPGPPGDAFPFGRPSLTLAPGEARVDVDIALPRTYATEGRVVDETGAPMAGVGVLAERGPGWDRVGVWFETDDRGLFRVYGLPPGTYRVCTSTRMFLPSVRLGDRADVRFVPTCYPAATAAGAAYPLRITNADLQGIEIRMQRSGVYTLTGAVVDASGAPARDAQVHVTRIERGGYAEIYPEIREGTFVVRGLADGEYRIFASTANPQERGRMQVRIEGADVAGVMVRTSPGATVRGRVVIEGNPMPAGAIGRMRIGVRQGFSIPTRPGLGAPSDAPNAGDLTFELTRLFDRVTLGVSGLPEGWAVRSMTYDGADITDRAVEFTPSDTGVLRVVLTDRVARLRVRLAEPSGQPARPVMVLVAPADPARVSGGLRAGGERTESGELDFGAFVPGDYLVAAVPLNVRLLGSEGVSDLEPLLRGAHRVTLAEGDDRVVEIPAPSPSGGDR